MKLTIVGTPYRCPKCDISADVLVIQDLHLGYLLSLLADPSAVPTLPWACTCGWSGSLAQWGSQP